MTYYHPTGVDKLKILFVSEYYKPAYVYGGPVRSLASLCEELVKLGVQVAVFTTDANGREHIPAYSGEPVFVNGVPVWYFPLDFRPYFLSAKYAAAVRSRVAEFELVVLGSIWSYSLPLTGRSCLKNKVPYIIPLHGQFLPWALHKSYWKKVLFLDLVGRFYINSAAGVHCTYEHEVDTYQRLGFNSPAFVVPHGIDSSSFSKLPQRGYFRDRFNIDRKARVLLFLGRISRIKRPDIALEVLIKLIPVYPDLHLILAGPDEDNLLPSLRARAHESGCAERFHPVGLVGDHQLLELFADSDILLMPTEVQENFGMSALEALAAGIPIIVSPGVPVGRWAEKVGAGLVLQSDVEDYEKNLSVLLAEPGILSVMGERGMRLVRDKFDISVVAQQMLHRYVSIVQTGSPHPIHPGIVRDLI